MRSSRNVRSSPRGGLGSVAATRVANGSWSTLEGRRDGAGVHALRAATHRTAADAGVVIVSLAFGVRNQGGPPPER
ncbi:hypothetical protein [Streptomyces sp. NPDC029004]|uniref:hypothetical protein n=1 Tax=Streptomyces sp. NPDC029004 TaxID=3154490 RepID=UPI0033C874CC